MTDAQGSVPQSDSREDIEALRGSLLRVAREHEQLVAQHLAAAEAIAADPGRRAEFIVHRARAFAHEWCLLLETPGADVSQVRELIDAETRVSASGGRTMSGVEEVAAWFAATAAAVANTAHAITTFSAVEHAPRDVDVALEFAWHGLTAEGQAMRARTHHEWRLTERPARFPVLRTFHVTIVEPFAPTTAAAALASLRSASSLFTGR